VAYFFGPPCMFVMGKVRTEVLFEKYSELERQQFQWVSRWSRSQTLAWISSDADEGSDGSHPRNGSWVAGTGRAETAAEQTESCERCGGRSAAAIPSSPSGGGLLTVSSGGGFVTTSLWQVSGGSTAGSLLVAVPSMTMTCQLPDSITHSRQNVKYTSSSYQRQYRHIKYVQLEQNVQFHWYSA